jgi:hypothetical protein
MKRRPPAENTPLVVALAAGSLALVTLFAWQGGLADKLDREELVTLAIFIAAFGLLTYAVDAQVRALVDRGIGAVRAGVRNLVAARLRPAVGRGDASSAAARSPGASRGAT